MNIIVCIKEILDPEIPSDKFRLDTEVKRVIPPAGIRPIINPYDERAVELAIRVKETYGGKIMVLTAGVNASVSVVKHAISMGADDGVIIADQAFEGSDSFGTAHILAQAIKKIGIYDLILCGREAADWDEGLVGPILAENLSLSLVTLVEEIDVMEKGLKVKRVTLNTYQVFGVPLPAVITVGQEVGRPRLPTGKGIILAARKQLPVWNAQDINVDFSQIGVGAARRKLVKLFIPKRERKCEIVEGETASEAAVKLAGRLREIGAI
jgi:electron transfer flavoprotein beta subunit